MLNPAEDAHIKSMSTFASNGHLQALTAPLFNWGGSLGNFTRWSKSLFNPLEASSLIGENPAAVDASRVSSADHR